MFTFLSPLFLIGLLSAAIPLIIHLSRSRRTKKIRFSSTRFLTDQFLRSYRMSRLKELLLLAVRMALCALFAVALAQPLFLPKGHSFLWGRSRSVVLVIDDSASMGYREAGETLLDRARRGAVELIDGLKEGDTASLVLAGRRASGPEVLFPDPTTALGDVRQSLDSIVATALGTDLSGALARAEQIVESSAAESKEIYVFSDLQDAGWELPDAAAEAKAASGTLFFFVSVRPERPRNLAVTAIEYASARPMAGVPFAIRPHVRNDGDEAQAAAVEMFIDGKKVAEQQLEKLPAGRWATPKFHHTFTAGGWHSGYVQVTGDALEADNRRYFAFEVLDAVKVLAVNGAPSAVPRLDELFFLKAALTAGATGQSPIEVAAISPAALATTEMNDYPLVILANVESLPAPAVEKLEAFVDRGGSLLIFLGDKTNPAFYNQAFAGSNRLHGGLLPGRIGALTGNPSSETQAAFVGAVDSGHVVLSAFDDDASGALAGVSFNALWEIEPGGAAVLMRTNAGAPLLCEKPFGKGRVVLFAATCDRDWTNFPVRPAFVPWLYRLVGYLSQSPLAREGFYATGDAVPLPVSATEGIAPLLVRRPDGSVGNIGAGNAPSPAALFMETDQTGVYSVYAPGKEHESQRFVANLESYESDLTYLDDVFAGPDTVEFDGAARGQAIAAQSPSGERAPHASARAGASRQTRIEAGLKELLPGRPLVSFVDNPARVSDASLAARRGFKLWDMVLAAALAIALFEPWFANRIAAKHYLKPSVVSPRSVVSGPLSVVAGLRNGADNRSSHDFDHRQTTTDH